MKRNKYMLIAVSLILVLSIILPGYAQQVAPKKTIVIGGVPAEWVGKRIMGSLVADVIGRETPYETKIVGGLSLISRERYGALMDGKIDVTIDITGIDMLLRLMPRIDPALGKRFRYLALFPEGYQPIPLIVHKDLPITSLRDAIDKKYPLKVGTGRIGSFDLMDIIWEAMGAPDGINAVEKWGGRIENTTSPPGIPAMMREGILNAYMCLGDTWSAGLEEINRVQPLKALPVAQHEEDLERIKKVTIALDRYVMKAGHYKFVTTDTPIIGNLRFFIGSPKLTDEEAYNIVKAVWEQRKFLGKTNIDFRDGLTPEAIKTAVKLEIPFHPGAESFYREAGIW